MKANIKGVCTHSQEGEEFVTKNGNFYVKLLIAVSNGESIYDAVFLTPKAHWKVEEVFASAGKVAPSATEIETSHFNDLIGSEIDVSTGKNKNGYDCIKKFYPAKSNADVVDENVPDEIAEQSADVDLDEDVPF